MWSRYIWNLKEGKFDNSFKFQPFTGKIVHIVLGKFTFVHVVLRTTLVF